MNQGNRILNCHLIAFLALLLTSCKEETTRVASPQATPKDTLFVFGVGEKEVWAELAAKPSEREKGLMNRDSLPDGKGMLFVFEKPGPQRFWMKNTRIPLDIGYFSPNGKLLEIHAAKPYDLGGEPSHSKKVQFVLELNLNGFRTMGIRIGDRLDLKALSKALRERGLEPKEYGLP